MTNQTSDNGTQCSVFVIEKFSNNLQAIVVMTVLVVVEVVFALLCNATLIIALCRYTKTCLSDNNITKVLMSSMAFVDLLSSFIVAPPGIILFIYNGSWTMGLPMFKIWQGYSILLCAVSAAHIFCMAFDKYLAICQPTRYRILPNKTGCILVLLAWIVPSSVLVAMVGLSGDSFGNTENDDCFQGNILQYIKQNFYKINFIVYSALMVTPLALTYILYVLIYLEIRQWSKRATHFFQLDKMSGTTKSYSAKQTILPQTVFLISQTAVLFDVPDYRHGKTTRLSNEPKSYRWKRNLKAIRTIASIVICFTVCWLPSMVMSVAFSQGYPVPIEVYGFTYWITLLNSTLNPLLCLGVKFVRSALRMLLS